MQAADVKTAEDAVELIRERNVKDIKVAVFDSDGIMRGKYMSRDRFLSALESGFGFCDVVLGWDSHDQMYDNTSFTGRHTAYPDALVRILPETCRELPLEDNTLLFLGEFAEHGEAVCPRGVLRRVLRRAADMGLMAQAACEFEFHLFDETPQSIREKHYQNLQRITPGFFGYSVLHNSVFSEFYQDLMHMGREMDFPLEGLHTQTGPGVLEAAIAADEALSAADKAALFKTFTKVLAQRNGWMASFMAKWSPDEPGQSGHIHLSLKDSKSGKPVFHDSSKENAISDSMRHFIGGQQKLMPELLAMTACTVNSYTRLTPGAWAPTAATWGFENRTTALRAIGGSAEAQRVEYRIAGADIHPHIALAAAIGSGLWGVEHRIEPSVPMVGDAHEKKAPRSQQLPRTLGEAAERLQRSKAANELFGKDFVDHYAATREWEDRQARKAITDWQLNRYFEII